MGNRFEQEGQELGFEHVKCRGPARQVERAGRQPNGESVFREQD